MLRSVRRYEFSCTTPLLKSTSRPAYLEFLPRFSSSNATALDVRPRLMQELKEAMKSKDTIKSTTIRSVLSEVYAADKAASSGTAPPAAIVGILRKAATRRTDAAAEFAKAARRDLAEKERLEAAILHAFLPPLLPQADIDRVLADVLTSPVISEAVSKGPAQKALGQVFKAFYARVDKSSVDPDLVRARAQALLS
ncbi:Yqey-like protein-domain-containing protein [Trametes meyenii]|nr:Yqey-like protein-domain-containing protein [Trametes meyenii]